MRSMSALGKNARTSMGDHLSGEWSAEGDAFEEVGLDGLQSMCQEGIDKLAQFSSVYAVANPRLLLSRGRLKVLTGKTSEGLKDLRKAQQLAHKMEMPYDEALALMWLSKYTKASLKEAAACRQEASEIFVKLGVLVPEL